MAEMGDIIGEADIQQVMEAVGLSVTDLISEAEHLQAEETSRLLQNVPETSVNSLRDTDPSSHVIEMLNCKDASDDMLVLQTSAEGQEGGLEEGNGSQFKLDISDRHEEDLNKVEKEGDNAKLNSSSTGGVRRSNRTTAKTPSETSPAPGRTTRSQINPEIIAKQKSFMHKYQIAVKSSMDSYVRNATGGTDPVVGAVTKDKSEQQPPKRKWEDSGGESESVVVEKKSRKSVPGSNNPLQNKANTTGNHLESVNDQKENVIRHDTFCWSCHSDAAPVMQCRDCPRVFHQRCVQLQSPIPAKWLCTECVAVRNAEKQNRSATVGIDDEQLEAMLTFALERIKSVADAQPFFKPVDTLEFPHYTEYVVCPVDIGKLEEKVANRAYTSPRAFLAEFRWILHNCIIFNSIHSKLTGTARTLMKVCKHEMQEIETCADCYLHAHTKRETWFLEPCRKPHLLLWAKLKGFPHWPAKAMKSTKEGSVDVRFFGAHDRAWVPSKDCYLYSKEPPVQMKNQKKSNLVTSIEEVDQHIKKLVEHFGSFAYPPARTAYNPLKEDEQLRMLIPGFKISDDYLAADRSIGDTGDDESVTSDSEEEMEDSEDEMKNNDVSLPIDSSAKSTDVVADPAGSTSLEEGNMDRTEDRNFLAMLQLAPRSSVDSPTTDGKPVSGGKPPGKMTRSSRASSRVPSEDATPIDASNHRNSNGSEAKEGSKSKKLYLVTPSRRTSAAKETPVKSDLVKDGEEEEDDPTVTHLKDRSSVALSVDKVVAGTKSGQNTSTIPRTSKAETQSGKVLATASVPKIGVKNHSGSGKPHIGSNKPSTNSQLNNNKPTFKTHPKVSSNFNRLPPKGMSNVIKSGTGHKSASGRRPPGRESDEAMDPAMYLDPTITITLINSDNDKRHNGGSKGVGEISSSDLQALNALGENVSITVVPKKKVVSSSGSLSRFKENEAFNDQQQPMVIEVDPVSLQKARGSAPQHHQASAKARKSFPNNKSPASSRPVAPNAHNKSGSGSHRNATGPPMVTIPNRHLGKAPPAGTVLEAFRSHHQMSSSSSTSTPARIPSITVRPVSQSTPSQPNIILQSGANAADAPTATLPSKQASSGTASSGGGNGSLMLNTMHTLGTDSSFGAGGLLLTFNRSPQSLSSANSGAAGAVSPSKSECGPLTAHVAARTQQISDMVRSTLDSLIQEMSSSGVVEAKMIQLQLELERCRSQQQIDKEEAKKNLEARQTAAEADKQRALAELRSQMEAEKQKAIDEIKKKQWCAECSQEAIFYCCWNTAYCDYPCQQAHWPKHMASCANANQYTEDGELAEQAGESQQTEAAASSEPSTEPSDKTVATSMPMPQVGVVNGSPSPRKRTASGSTALPTTPSSAKLINNNNTTPSPISGYAVITSPDMGVSPLTDPSLNNSGIASTQSSQSVVPIVMVSTPVRPAVESSLTMTSTNAAMRSLTAGETCEDTS